jgi:hypothetical protein
VAIVDVGDIYCGPSLVPILYSMTLDVAIVDVGDIYCGPSLVPILCSMTLDVCWGLLFESKAYFYVLYLLLVFNNNYHFFYYKCLKNSYSNKTAFYYADLSCIYMYSFICT